MNYELYLKQKLAISLALLSLTVSPAYAAIPTEIPDGGTVLNGTKQPVQQQPVRKIPDITIQGQQPAQQGSDEKILVKGFTITGDLPVPQQELLDLAKSRAGSELTLAEIYQVAESITQHLRQKGYILANAYVPAQTIKEGMVTVQVVAGRYGNIKIDNQSTLKTAVAVHFFSSLKSGDYITQAELERTLLLFNDLSGVSVKTTLLPGTTADTSDLVAVISDTAKSDGQVYSDNWGNRYTGHNRLGFSADTNNFTRAGDVLSINGLYAGSGMHDYGFNYTLSTGQDGGKFGVGYSSMHYLLGAEYNALNASGVADTVSLFRNFVIKRSRDNNLNIKLAFDNKTLRDQVQYIGNDVRKKAQVWSLMLNGDSRDSFGGGGYNSYSLGYETGRLSLDSADALAGDAKAGARGSFGKTLFNFKRLQKVTDRLTFYAAINGQLADKNLDSSEKFQLGGPTGVRAYPVGEASCDQGYVVNGELRWDLPKPNVQLIAFYDNGKALINKHPWAGAGENKRILAGAGLGLAVNTPSGYAFRLDYAWKITTNNPAEAAPDANGRLWLQAIKYF